jgi:alcohol dehydrogenase
VVGGGGIALYAVGVALALGASGVDYFDRDVGRLARAERIGARPVEGLPERLPDTYPVTVDASADPDGLRLAISSTAVEGTCTSIGIYFQPTDMPLLRMYTKGITFRTGMAHARRDLPAVLELVSSGRLHPELATGVVADWADADDALAELSDKTVIKRGA